ncbi:MAG: FAD-dependent oxidoreductase [Myxococcota bacterium]|jgi:selenide,water dikinase|nr:FAD-dependent oxidoreductase [Myxococcota bacterium]
MGRRLVLVGGGHAHVEFIRRWADASVDDVELVVCDANPRPVYSGMVPGVVAGQYRKQEVEIDLAAVCSRAGARFVREAVVDADAEARVITSEGGERIDFDLASIDVGSTVVGLDAPGVRDFALASRPIGRLIAEIDDWIARAAAQGAGVPLHVVGGGAAGVELAFCIDARLAGSAKRDASASPAVEIVSSDEHVLTSAHPRVRDRVTRALARRGIGLRTGTRVVAVREDAVELDAGETLPSQGVVWVTGPAAHPLPAASKLPCDDRGFVRIRPTLEVEGHDHVFAVGDCASLPGLAKAGVYAVRATPILDDNLRARLRGHELRDYIPQRDFLSLLNLGNGTAIGTKWGVVYEGRAAMWLKDRIDRGFMERYR